MTETIAHPEEHKPRLVTSGHVRGISWLDKIADAVNDFCGSMWVLIIITIGIVARSSPCTRWAGSSSRSCTARIRCWPS